MGKKSGEKNEPFFWRIFFRGLSFYGADCNHTKSKTGD
jgi:hypothetical protein